MSWFKKAEPVPPLFVDGERRSVQVTGLGYKLAELPRAFGELSRMSEHEFVAVLRPIPANDWFRTPVEVWVNDVHIGYIADHLSSRYWKWLKQLGTLVSCECIVVTTSIPVAGQGFQVGGAWLSLPERLPGQA